MKFVSSVESFVATRSYATSASSILNWFMQIAVQHRLQ